MSRMKKPFAAPGTPRVPVAEFTPEMKRTHTILIPMMLPIHFELIEKVLQNEGYKTELLRTEGSRIAEEGLKNVHNDKIGRASCRERV